MLQITFAFLPLEMVVTHVFLETMRLHCSTHCTTANRLESQENTIHAQSLCLACVYTCNTHVMFVWSANARIDSITQSTFRGAAHVRSPNEMSSMGESLITEKRQHIKRYTVSL